jgi:hypothetical protein
MNRVVRVVAGLAGVVGVVLGVKQVMSGVHELSDGSPATQPQQLGETYASAEGGYTHRIPRGWEVKPAQPPMLIKIVAPKESGYVSSMIVTSEPFEGSLRQYVDANIKSLRATGPDAKIVTDSEFTTDAKASAYKVQLSNKMKDLELAQTMYFFDGPSSRKIIVTCTATAKQGPELASLFDESMKTFALSRP